MTAQKSDMAALPNWPRCLSREQAAAYVGVSPGTFDKEVAAGLWPPGQVRGRRVLWDRRLIDRAQDERSGLMAISSPVADAEAGLWDAWK